ncbi:MAG: phage portal protein [Methanogenium sp.]|jgi:HK97 family phage portal protein
MSKFRWPWQKQKASSKQFAVAVDYGKGTVIWASDDYRKFMSESFMINVIAFQCMNIIARAVSSAKWCVQSETKDGEYVNVNNPLMRQLFKRSNIYDTWTFMLYKSVCHLLANGNTYLHGIRTSFSQGIPKEIWVLRPDLMKVQLDITGTRIQNYIYTPVETETLNNETTTDKRFSGSSIAYPVDPITGNSDILHIKSFNPISDIYGMPITKPIARDIDISNAGAAWNMSMMQNEARPGMMVILKGHLEDEQFARLQKQFELKHSGSENAGKSIIIEGDDGIVDLKPYSFSPKDVEFLEGGRETARRIALGYGVPPQMLGIPGDNTYSNYKEARSAFYEDTVMSYFTLYSEALTHWIFGRDINSTLYIKPDLDTIPAFAEMKAALWERVKLVDYLTDNEKRKLVGYKTYGAAGDYLWKPAGLIPLTEDSIDEMLAPVDETIPAADPDNPDNAPVDDTNTDTTTDEGDTAE